MLELSTSSTRCPTKPSRSSTINADGEPVPADAYGCTYKACACQHPQLPAGYHTYYFS